MSDLSSAPVVKILLALILSLTSPCWSQVAPDQILKSLEKSLSTRAANFPPANGKALEGAPRTAALLDLRFLLEMEKTLRELSNDPAALQEKVEIEELSRSEQKRTIELRAEANQYRAASLVDPTAKGPRSNPVDKLRKAFERKARKPLLEISKARKSLNREYDRNIPNDRAIDELEEEIATFEKDLAVLRTAFFGNVPDQGFEATLETFGGGPASPLIKKVITARDQVITALRLDPKAVAKDGEVKKGEVGGIRVRSSNLGVVLDNSSSMQPHLPELRKEINNGFPGSHFREVYGCALTWQAGTTTLGQREHVLLAMEDLIIVKRADAIYWFSDLRDPVSPSGLERLRDLLKRSGALFYVSSVDQKPDDDLEDLVTKFRKK